WQRGAGQGAAAERTNVDSAQAILKPFAVALRHFNVGKQAMGKIDRLRALQVSVPGHYDLPVRDCELNQALLESPDFTKNAASFVAQPEAHVQHYLIVSGTARVQLRAGRDPAG